MTRTALLLFCLCSLARAASEPFAWAPAPTPPAGPSLTLAVDLTRLPDQDLVDAREWITAPDLTTLAYPLWIPGTHAPSGPVVNLGGLTVSDAQGKPVAWERDPKDPWTIHLHADHALTTVRLDLTYIANQPSVNSEGVDCAGGPRYGLVCWNCLLFYPPAIPSDGISCAVSTRLPAAWDFATALSHGARAHDIVAFDPTSLTELIDRPLLCGTAMQHLVLRPDGAAPGVVLNIVAEDAGEGTVPAAGLRALERMPDEADRLFGGSWFSHYDILMLVGSQDLGLEHGSCSVDGLEQKGLDDVDDIWSHELTPHEFVHSWNGKHRRPQGMLLPNFQDVPVFDDLWVYEGLTELLGRVLAVRCGYLDAAAWRAGVLDDLRTLERTPGRNWRSLRDTCRCNWQLRGGAIHHPELRRNQDFYDEGSLFWLVADRRIRAATGGKKSLDDFCQSFLGPHGARSNGYTEAELIAALGRIAPLDWAGSVKRWIDGTGPLDTAAVMDGSGWHIQNVQLNPDDEEQMAHVGQDTLRAALDCTIYGGYVVDVQTGGVAQKDGLAIGDFIYAANNRKIQQNDQLLVRELSSAAAQSPTILSVYHQQGWKLVKVVPKPMTIEVMVRDASFPDDFAPLIAARVPPAAPATAAASSTAAATAPTQATVPSTPTAPAAPTR